MTERVVTGDTPPSGLNCAGRIYTATGAGHGQYWFTAVDSATMEEFDRSPVIIDDARNTTQNQSPASAPASRNLQNIHRAHLGSTRLMTDENGAENGRWNYFPFGIEATAEESGNQRMKFRGHERDGEVELNYMLARYASAYHGRFLSVDPVPGQVTEPQSWDRYAYVRNSPLLLLDPLGLAAIVYIDSRATGSYAKGWSLDNVVKKVSQMFAKTGAAVSVYKGRPGLFGRLKAWFKGDKISTQTIRNGSAEEFSYQRGRTGEAEIGGSSGESTVFGHADAKGTPDVNELENGLANNVAHEAGHNLGLKHNDDSPPTLMSPKVNGVENGQDLDFNEKESEKLREMYGTQEGKK